MTMLSLWNYNPLTNGFFESGFQDGSIERDFVPPCDIEEKDGHFLLSMDVPGLKKEDIHIEVEKEILTISGLRKEEKSTTKGVLKSERFSGKFYRAFSLGESVDVKRIEASYEDGVLRLLIPREKEVKPEVIKIKVGEKYSDTH